MAGLYIHIPFCHSKCSYCDFYSGRWTHTDFQAYIDAVIMEWQARRLEDEEPINTLYIGGGTPSIVPIDIFRRLIDRLDMDVSALDEFTVEANPEDVTPPWVETMVRCGVGRVSMGVQSLVADELAAIGRRHSPARAMEAVEYLKAGGITNISCDLIYGLPGQSAESFLYSLNTLLSMKIPHLSAYMLTYEQGTRLYVQRQTGKIEEASDDVIERMYHDLIVTAAAYGFDHYEISNFALPGYRARHNSSYWDGTPYIGLGPSAHSFDGMTRRANLPDLKRYMADPVHCSEEEVIDGYTAHNDRIITGLRTDRGVSMTGLTKDEAAALEGYLSRGMMQKTDMDRYRITESGWLMADAIMADFIRVD